ncbi:hypothetical protein FNT36_14975 [Hymenobacter setariae]|uniref:Uncharacterized protein n=1 Tax=Hymenobacter setariae TaxID=2594794 RepID=A0A558BR36_9BACT|nr:hypothetical protein [Hymenobacter setariae]TVT38972.1 hypothetical protein FNT36_14975 [Hymenobacter setariae]
MSLTYNCLFAGPSPGLHQILDQLVDEHLDEILDPLTDDSYFYFYESNGNFYLCYNDESEPDKPEESKPILLIYPHSKTEMYELALGEFKAESSWYIDTNNSRGMAIADQALARLLHSVLKQYVGDLVSLFNGAQIILYRTGERVYLDKYSDIAQEPMISLLGLKEHELRDYKVV